MPFVHRAEQRRPGTLKGQISISADFDELPDGFRSAIPEQGLREVPVLGAKG